MHVQQKDEIYGFMNMKKIVMIRKLFALIDGRVQHRLFTAVELLYIFVYKENLLFNLEAMEGTSMQL